MTIPYIALIGPLLVAWLIVVGLAAAPTLVRNELAWWRGVRRDG